MYFTLNKIQGSKPICRIVGGKYDGETVSYVDGELNLNTSEGKYIDFVSLNMVDGKFTMVCNPYTERQVISFLGPSGAGKSYLVNEYLKSYRQKNKNNMVYLLSSVDEDTSLSSDVKRIKLDADYMSDPLEIKDFPDSSCLIFDDCDVLNPKDLKKQVLHLQNECLQIGRHKHITVLNTSHSATNGLENKIVLNESHIIVIYLSSGFNYTRLLTAYFGLNTKQINKLKSMKTRWTAFVRSYPLIIFTETSLFFLKDL